MLQVAYDRTTLHAEASFYERYHRPYSVEIEGMLIQALRQGRRRHRTAKRGRTWKDGRCAIRHDAFVHPTNPDRERWHYMRDGQRYDFIYDRREGMIITFLLPAGVACPK